jgi:hypothetical protein
MSHCNNSRTKLNIFVLLLFCPIGKTPYADASLLAEGKWLPAPCFGQSDTMPQCRYVAQIRFFLDIYMNFI